jgi:hypothetical protein
MLQYVNATTPQRHEATKPQSHKATTPQRRNANKAMETIWTSIGR